MTNNISTSDPTPAPEKPQAAPGGLTSAAPTLDDVNGLWADLHAGRIPMPDFLTRLAEMQAAFFGG